MPGDLPDRHRLGRADRSGRRPRGLGSQVEFRSITVDPQRDHGAQLSAYDALFAPNPANCTSLTGPPAVVFFLDARQHERFVIEGPPHLVGTNVLPATLDIFMDHDGHRSLAHPHPTDWTPPQAITVIDWLRSTV